MTPDRSDFEIYVLITALSGTLLPHLEEGLMAVISTSHYWDKSVPYNNFSLKALNGLSSAISMLGVKIIMLFLPHLRPQFPHYESREPD